MSTFADQLHSLPAEEVFEPQVHEQEQEASIVGETDVWDPQRFAEEQIRRLVRQVFLPGWPKPARQVVFSAVDTETDSAEICLQVGETLAAQVAGSVCVVEATFHGGRERPRIASQFGREGFASLREASHRLSSKLWLVSQEVFRGENDDGFSAVWLRGKLAELRLEFDYTVLQGPAAGMYSQAALLGHLCDGVVLVLEANSTRRVAAQRAKETLNTAHARLLGTVLKGRTFPVPRALYRML